MNFKFNLTKVIFLILYSFLFSLFFISCSTPQEQMISYVKENKESEVIHLIKNGVEIEYSDKREKLTALQIASNLGFLGMVNSLIKLGAEVNGRGRFDSYTPLMFACENGHFEIVQLLIEKGADVNEPRDQFRIDNNLYTTPLAIAARAGKLDIVKELIKSGANVNTKVYNSVYRGWTPLMFAARNNHRDIVAVLLRNKASVNDYDERTLQTAIYHAVMSENVGMVDMLINAGANVNHLDAKRYPPERYAEYEIEDKDTRGLILARLRKAGSQVSK